MASKWFDKKPDALKLRKSGLSIGVIETRLGIPRSTLSGWFKHVVLTKHQKEVLFKKWQNGLVSARKKAGEWHNAEKKKRLEAAQVSADEVIKVIDLADRNILDLILAVLYLGEGGKSNDSTNMGNSDPLIMKAFLAILIKNYNIDLKRVRCSLNVRADQDIEALKKFWLKELNLPPENMKYVYVDKRTIGSKTYPNYKGVCTIECGNVAIKRKLLNISRGLFERIASAHSSMVERVVDIDKAPSSILGARTTLPYGLRGVDTRK